MFKNQQNHREQGRGRRFFWGVVLIGGAIALWSLPQGCTRGHGPSAHGSAEQTIARIDRGAEWAMREVEAGEEQRTKIAAS